MKIIFPQIRHFLVVISVIASAFVLGWYAHDKLPRLVKSTAVSSLPFTVPADKQNIDFSLFWQVWDKLESEYFDKTKLDSQKMFYGAIAGMVEAVGDPYTVFLPPAEAKRTQEDLDGKFEGVGIEIGFKGTRLAVIAPLDGTPAQKAGVKAGDFIVGIKDEKKGVNAGTSGMNLVDAVEAIRGPAGTKVTLVLIRDGEGKPIEIEVARAKIEVPSIKLSFVGDKEEFAHLRLLRFGGNTTKEWNKAINDIRAKNTKGVILDLRNNPGGYLPGAVDIASEFLASGIVLIEEDGKGKKIEMPVSSKARLANTKLVVLVNSGSASASEIVAGALKDNRRAEIVGEKTFGKGTIQEAKSIGEAGFHITIAKWLTSSGTWVDQKGLEPDVEVKDDPESEVDEQLQKAIELLTKGNG